MDLEWVSESEIKTSDGRVFYILNPEWMRNLLKIMEEPNDNDTTKNQEIAQSS